ncbi:uncharacterized protein LOC107268316 isoform X2 [Cephus cinctus]|nr:uncharacterized protein LOC107268316 isoform X2 [Cephus cinctus]XP_024941413.1 uncharacterized protein LOC107268316 isoform X2 [Cephus cinctus]XP_024941414.1 uncharacterized protein LOC107268316 isoform X2 [Cephus cinctus]XP_024941415.1 uncharacterized protein LOC107268316 isoform X2 [Cephus cinctus]XP_024941416.1 uncharacterized protein LOC107268316 isoform X2 [Cephus cinctus]XP_024941417.1 uncharacterized protein LOC107268316 isoform X2 [Cephus cinctus]XP_024941418.1 uncharacterized prot
MHLILLIVALSLLRFLPASLGQDFLVTRHGDGDIFTINGSCTEACTILSSGTASPYPKSTGNFGQLSISNSSCMCQCNKALPVFREDLHICVDDINECSVAGFLSHSGNVEAIPYVFLPQREQIIYPQAEIRFQGVATPVCGITGAQQLGKSGWMGLRNLSDAEPPFRLFRDEGRTFLQWIGDAELRDATEGRVVLARLVCRDASPSTTKPTVFTPCVAFRVAGSPSKNSVREVMFSPSGSTSQGLSTIEYTAIGVSSVLLALIYIASVSLYLQSRRARRKRFQEPEAPHANGRDPGIVKNNPLLSAGRHFESDTNSGLSESDLGDDLGQSDGEPGFENQITSAIVHPHCVYLEPGTEGFFGSGSILGERIPDEDVRIVETVENAHLQDFPALPGTQRRKLYFNPAYFDRQLLLAPPPAAVEFLMKIREVISIAKHKMAVKKFVPTLNGIPEEERSVSEKESSAKPRVNSVQGSVARSRKSQGCTGCPGCQDIIALPAPSQPCPGESRIRAWLQDVKPPERRWKDPEESKRNFQENARNFARSLEYLKNVARQDIIQDGSQLNARTLSVWKNKPAMLRSFQEMARSEILDNEDRYSVSKRSTKSMFEQSIYDRFSRVADAHQVNNLNAKVQQIIENSFKKQMEESIGLEEDQKRFVPTFSCEEATSVIPQDSEKASLKNSLYRDNTLSSKTSRIRSHKDSNKLPDMITELPGSKNPTKRIMDAVIREMVDVKALDQVSKTGKVIDYEVDSLERSKSSRKSSPDQSSPALSTALPMTEELTMRNAIFNRKTGQMTMSKLEKDFYDLPEVISQRNERYSLVSEVYVNDGYASPAGSEDSGPEIQYEPENPGHLTIKVQDSPENYVKQDESEYEPDTLDRKPMKLKINGEVNYDKEILSEVYVDSLERPAQILLRSKGSFRNDDSDQCPPLERGYGSLREIYEARIRSNLKDSSFVSGSTKSLNGDSEKGMSWRKTKYLTPDSRQARRQRKQNQPDVVPLPPSDDFREAESCQELNTFSKNGWDRSQSEAGNPTASQVAPVVILTGRPVGTHRILNSKQDPVRGKSLRRDLKSPESCVCKNSAINKQTGPSASCKGCPRHTFWSMDASRALKDKNSAALGIRTKNRKGVTLKVEDSGYLSSTDSNGSQKHLLKYDVSTVSETDETESVCDGASESGAESVGTDSVFFDNFRRFSDTVSGNFRCLSDASGFSKSMDSGVDLGRSQCVPSFGISNPVGTEKSFSDSENESLITVLVPGSQHNSLVS